MGGGPRNQAGLKERDLLESINGKTAQSISSEELEALLRSGNGTILEICVRRSQETICEQLELADPKI